jgi:PAS domain S-box-containing protein
MVKNYISKIINLATKYQDDKQFIIRIQAMNRMTLVGLLICISTTIIGFIIDSKTFRVTGFSVIIIFLISLFLTYKNRPKLGWHIIFIFPISIFTILPLFYPTSPALMVFFMTLQVIILVIFKNPKILAFYFFFYSLNLILFIVLLFYFFPEHINLDIKSSLIDITVSIILIFLALRFYIQSRLANDEILHLEETKFKTVFESSPIGMVLTDLTGNYTASRFSDATFMDINNAFLKSFGYSKKELEIEGIKVIKHTEDKLIATSEYEKLLKGEIADIKISKRYMHKSGRVLWTAGIINLVRNDYGEPLYSISMLLDITEQKEQEQKINNLVEKLKNVNIELESKVNQRTADLKTANEDLERSNQDLEQFAYAASHDLKEPLRMISSFVQIINKKYSDKLDDKGKEYIGYTVEGVTRMSALIDSLLQYSRVGRKESKLRKTKISNLIELKLMDLRQVIEEKNAQVNVLESPEFIVCESVQIGLVFYNLINNGLKFNTNEKPTITIKGEEREGDYLFSVSDNGIGIEAKFKEQVFEIFKRLHGREKYEGTGIGLALCRKIIYRHEGDIWLESEIGQGTTFYFTIKKRLLEY